MVTVQHAVTFLLRAVEIAAARQSGLACRVEECFAQRIEEMPSRDIERAALAVKRRILRLAIRFVVLDLAEQRPQLGVRPTVAPETRPVGEVRRSAEPRVGKEWVRRGK